MHRESAKYRRSIDGCSADNVGLNLRMCYRLKERVKLTELGSAFADEVASRSDRIGHNQTRHRTRDDLLVRSSDAGYNVVLEDLDAALYAAGESFVASDTVEVSFRLSHLDPPQPQPLYRGIRLEYCNVGAIQLTITIKRFLNQGCVLDRHEHTILNEL